MREYLIIMKEKKSTPKTSTQLIKKLLTDFSCINVLSSLHAHAKWHKDMDIEIHEHDIWKPCCNKVIDNINSTIVTELESLKSQSYGYQSPNSKGTIQLAENNGENFEINFFNAICLTGDIYRGYILRTSRKFLDINSS